MDRKRAFTALFGMAAAAGLLSACSQQPEKTDTAAAPAAPVAEAPPPPPAPAPEPAPAAEAVKLNVSDATGAQLTGDPAAGAQVFKQCLVCHTAEPGKNGVGPSLHGIVGRAAGTVPNFKYSNANKTSGITWTEQELYTYLENPRKRIPGTIMAFPGLKPSKQRADLIAFLLTKK